MSTELLSAEIRQHTFEQSISKTLYLWPALSLAVENNWGGPDSADKRDWFAGVLVDQFPPITAASPPAGTPDVTGPDQIEYLETMLIQVMTDEFEVAVDDDSPYEIAQAIVLLRNQIVVGDFSEADKVEERFAKRSAKGSSGIIKKVEAQGDAESNSGDDSGGSGEEDEDEDMDEAPQLVHASQEKVEPNVDEDGFTTVVNKKRR